MRRGMYRLETIVLFATLLLPAVALGQSRTGRIEGTIYDDEGMPMAGAKVVLSSPTQIGGNRTTVTDAEGSFRFIGLIPGKFSVRVRKGGFVGAKRTGLRVSVGKTVTLDILLDRARVKKPKIIAPTPVGEDPDKPAPGEVITPKPKAETYVIKAARPVVDVTKATTGESLSDEFVANVPIQGRSYQGVAGMTAGVTQERDQKGAGQGNPSVAGGAYFNNNYYVDGMDTTDPVTHTFATNFNFDAMADVQVLTGGMGPEYSDTPGGVVNMVTKSGSNELELDSSIYYQADALTAKREDDGGGTFRQLDLNLNIGGPIIRDKLWYFTSFEFNQRVSTVPSGPALDLKLPLESAMALSDHPSRNYTGGKGLIKLTWQPSAKHKLVFWTQGAPASISNTSQLTTVESSAEGHQDQYNVLATGAWEWLASDSMFMKTQIGFGWNGLRISPQSDDTSLFRVSDVGTGLSRQNYPRILADDRYRFTANWDLTRFINGFFGDHEIKGGFRLQYLANPSDESYILNQVETKTFGETRVALNRYFLDFDDASACDPASDKYDANKCRQGTLQTTVSGVKLITFLKDTWKVPGFKRLRLIPGLGVHFGNTINPDGNTVTSFVTATPHFNFAWDLFADGKTVIRGGYNQYVDTGFLSLARFIGKDFTTYRCNWDPSTQTYSSNCRKGGQIRTVGMPQGPTYDKDGNVSDKFNPDALTVPRVHEVTVGAERQWFEGFSTGVDFQYRRYNNQWEDLETNVLWNQEGDKADGFKNGKSEFIYDLETPEEAWRQYLGMTLFARQFMGHWQLMLSYTYARNEGTVAEGYATTYLDRARQEAFYRGFLPDDRRHVVKLQGWYNWRKQVTVGGSFWLGTGTPYDKLYYNDFFGDYSDRRAPRGHDPATLSTPDDDRELRMPTRVAVNLKVTYNMFSLTKWLLGEPMNLELIGELFNLFNLNTVTRYEERNLPGGQGIQWGDVLDRQDPFKVRFGLRYRY